MKKNLITTFVVAFLLFFAGITAWFSISNSNHHSQEKTPQQSFAIDTKEFALESGSQIVNKITELSPTSTPPPRARFVPLDDPKFIKGADADLSIDDLVLGYSSKGSARAYPVSMMAYHHIANDRVVFDPLLVTY